MSTFLELKAQLQTLSREAEEAKQRELGTALTMVRDVVRTYGLSPEQINPSWKRVGTGKRKGPVAPKYRNPATGETWSGRGRTPRWMSGRSPDDFLIVRPPL
ncbi:H-NS histone family protein [Burkholderia sp. Bp9002]|nr:H-NS histone family protein [Burkholderia sp. Bp9125]RQS02360.1 H-NS histone family protein [Burkholderia sp. Bp9002]